MMNLQKEAILRDYLKKYPSLFSAEEIRSLYSLLHTDKKSGLLPDTIRQVYDELNFIKDEDNIYIGFINFLDDIFKIKDKRIIEVGGGILPRTGKRIATLQDSGRITVYDPLLSIYEKDKSNLFLKRKKFTNSMSVDDHNLLIGLMPCEAAQVIIESASRHNLDYMIALCEGGPHGDYFDYFERDEDWINSIIYYAESMTEDANLGKVKMKSLEKYGDPYPVIYNERD